jgi:oligoribonuclease NrnB/cAMP/cGMP phosphodiesterase (DHH superfamily)
MIGPQDSARDNVAEAIGYSGSVSQVCIYHAGCPDGFGAAWAVWRAWGDDARYIPRGHEDPLRARDFEGSQIVFVDIAPPLEPLRRLAERADQITILDHHVTARDRFESDPGLCNDFQRAGHLVHFDLDHSGAILAWRHFHPDEEIPALLRYVEDQDMWTWKLPDSEEINAAIGSHPQSFESWDRLAASPVEQLAAEGVPIVRTQRIEVAQALRHTHPISLGRVRVEAVDSRSHRSRIGHELASRARYGTPCGVVYRLTGTQVDASIYSVGDFDVSKLAAEFGGGGHPNASGFTVSLDDWIKHFV